MCICVCVSVRACIRKQVSESHRCLSSSSSPGSSSSTSNLKLIGRMKWNENKTFRPVPSRNNGTRRGNEHRKSVGKDLQQRRHRLFKCGSIHASPPPLLPPSLPARHLTCLPRCQSAAPSRGSTRPSLRWQATRELPPDMEWIPLSGVKGSTTRQWRCRVARLDDKMQGDVASSALE